MQTPKVDKAKNEIEYFKVPHPISFAIIVPSIIYLSLLAYFPDVLPLENLGALGTFSKYLLDNHKIILILTFWLAWAVHLFEAVYVVKIGKSLNISSNSLNKWFFQTLLVGFPSTRLILKFRKQNEKKK